MTTVSVNTYTHSVTYVADNMLKSLKDIIRLSGLDPTNFIEDWDVNMRGIKRWLQTQDLERVDLEIYDPKTDALLFRWDSSTVASHPASSTSLILIGLETRATSRPSS